MSNSTLILGWREWAALPQLGVSPIKAKVATGARESTLNAFFMDSFEAGGNRRVRFGVHPRHRDPNVEVVCEADVVEERWVRDGSRRDLRIFIRTELQLGPHHHEIELALALDEDAPFRLLIGRSAISRDFLVNPAESFLLGGNADSVTGPAAGQEGIDAPAPAPSQD